MSGDQLAEKIFKIRPDVPILLCTGYSEKMSESKCGHIGISGFAMKPLNMNEFAWTVRKVMDEKK